MGKSRSGEYSFDCIEAGQAHHIRCWPKANRSRSASEVGEGEGAAEEGGLEPREPAAKNVVGFSSGLLSYETRFICREVFAD